MAATIRLPGGLARALPLALLAGAAVATAGCELTSVELAESADVVVVEAYLVAGADTQRALLHRTVGGGGASRVDGATVEVVDPSGGRLRLAPAPDTACLLPPPASVEGGAAAVPGGSCYAGAAPGFVRAGATYELAVVLEDGGRIGGRTAVPDAFAMVRPEADSCVVAAASLELLWTAAAGAWAYQVEGIFRGLAPGLADRGVEDPPDTLRLLGLAIGAADTTLVFPGELGVFDRFDLDRELLLALAEGLPDGARADIVVAAADRNFVNWVRGGSFNPSGQVRVPSVTGAGTGVFASLVTRRRALLAPGSPSTGEGVPICQ